MLHVDGPQSQSRDNDGKGNDFCLGPNKIQQTMRCAQYILNPVNPD